MAGAGVEAFRKDLFGAPYGDVVDEWIFKGDVYAFSRRPSAYTTLRNHLSTRLKVPEEKIIVVGSAKTGFSLNPLAFGRPFNEASDIDVVVIDEPLFDSVWFAMLRWNYPWRRGHMPEADWRWTTKRRDELYWGWFAPDKIEFDGLSRPKILEEIKQIGFKWWAAFQDLARYPDFFSRKVSGRLYRSREHARLYHIDGLREIRSRLAGQEA